MPFDIEAARKAGATDDQILLELASANPNFDVNGAIKAGGVSRSHYAGIG